MIFSLNSRGNILQNIMIIPIFLFTFITLSIIGFFSYNQAIEAFNTTGLLAPNMEQAIKGFDLFYSSLDFLTILIFVALIIGLLISSFRVRSHPVFFITVFVMAPFLGFISYFLNFVLAEVVSAPIFAMTLAFFPISLIIGTNLHWVTLGAIVIASIALFAKKPTDFETIGGGGQF